MANGENERQESHGKVKCRSHLNGQDGDGTRAGESVRQVCSEGLGSLNGRAQDLEHITSCPEIYGNLSLKIY